MNAPSRNVHGCALSLAGTGVLVTGPARSGKSALCLSALRRGGALGLDARLVADDRVIVGTREGETVLSAPERLAGLIEISGVGILREASYAASVRLGLVVTLVEPETIERLPQPETTRDFGVPVRLVRLPARESAFGADVLVSIVLGRLVEDAGVF